MSLFRSIATVGGFTLLSRVTGLMREMMIAHFLGAGAVADAFFVAFRFPNLFRSLFAEGAFNAAFVPLFTGSTGHPGLPAFFSDDVTPKSVVDMVTAESKKQGATKTMDLESRTSSVWLFPTVFFWYKSVEVSGNAVK